VHQVGFTIEIYCYARSYKRQTSNHIRHSVLVSSNKQQQRNYTIVPHASTRTSQNVHISISGNWFWADSLVCTSGT